MATRLERLERLEKIENLLKGLGINFVLQADVIAIPSAAAKMQIADDQDGTVDAALRSMGASDYTGENPIKVSISWRGSTDIPKNYAV